MSDRFNELLPWYVNGTLDAADRAWFEQHLAENAEAREELAWYRSLQTQMRQDAPAVPPTIGLARTLHLIRGDRPTLAERVTGFFASLGMRPGLALAGAALMAVQGGVIFNLMQQGHEDTVEIRAIGPSRAAAGPLLKLSFAPGAREVDIRMALVLVQGSVAAGPGPQGDYFVRVPAGTEATSVEQLKANKVVRSVTLAAAAPAQRP
jgi:anti-sigma factor RsiW